MIGAEISFRYEHTMNKRARTPKPSSARPNLASKPQQPTHPEDRLSAALAGGSVTAGNNPRHRDNRLSLVPVALVAVLGRNPQLAGVFRTKPRPFTITRSEQPIHREPEQPPVPPKPEQPIHREPKPQEAGPLRNGNPRGNPNLAPRCGAKTRQGCPCKSPAMKNGRCRMHGGASTGPRTPEGRARIAAARTKHGRYSAAARHFRGTCAIILKRGKILLHLARHGIADPVAIALALPALPKYPMHRENRPGSRPHGIRAVAIPPPFGQVFYPVRTQKTQLRQE